MLDIFVLEDNKRIKDINNTHTGEEKNIEKTFEGE